MNCHFREHVSDVPISRRELLKGAAIAGAASAIPAVPAASAPADELPIEAFERLTAELSEVLNRYLNGRFYAKIYPSASHKNSVWLTSIAVERRNAAATCVQQSDCPVDPLLPR